LAAAIATYSEFLAQGILTSPVASTSTINVAQQFCSINILWKEQKQVLTVSKYKIDE